jgi:hypothetical protein
MKQLRVTIGALVLAALVPLAAAAALIVPVSQTRSVSAFAQIDAPGGLPSSSSFSAGDFGPWSSQTAGATSYHPSNPGWYVGNSVRQTSSIGEDRLSAHVSGSFGGAGGVFGPYAGDVDTQSLYDITFDVLEPVNYRLGNGREPFSFGSHVVTLRNESGQVLAQPPPAYYYPPGSDDLLAWMSVASGALAPGRYRLTAHWDGGFAPDPGTWTAAAVLRLTAIPEPGTALLVALGLGALAARRERAPRR